MSKPLLNRTGETIGNIATEGGKIVITLEPSAEQKPSKSGKMLEVSSTGGFVQIGQIGGNAASLNLYLGTKLAA